MDVRQAMNDAIRREHTNLSGISLERMLVLHVRSPSVPLHHSTCTACRRRCIAGGVSLQVPTLDWCPPSIVCYTRCLLSTSLTSPVSAA